MPLDINSIRFDFEGFSSQPQAKGQMLCWAQVVILGAIVIRRIRVVQFPNGTVGVFMPSRLNVPTGQREDTVVPVVREDAVALKLKVLRELEAELIRRQAEGDEGPSGGALDAVRWSAERINNRGRSPAAPSPYSPSPRPHLSPNVGFSATLGPDSPREEDDS